MLVFMSKAFTLKVFYQSKRDKGLADLSLRS